MTSLLYSEILDTSFNFSTVSSWYFSCHLQCNISIDIYFWLCCLKKLKQWRGYFKSENLDFFHSSRWTIVLAQLYCWSSKHYAKSSGSRNLGQSIVGHWMNNLIYWIKDCQEIIDEWKMFWELYMKAFVYSFQIFP